MSLGFTNRWMYMIAWLLATVILWGIGLGKLAELDYRPMIHNSSSVNMLRLKLNQLDQLASKRNHLSAGLGDLSKASASMPQLSTKIESHGSNEAQAKPAIPAPSSPLFRISGIIRATTDPGRHFYSALIEGKLYSPKERISDFLIENISSSGIMISGQGQRWFIPAPDVYYSIHRSP